MVGRVTIGHGVSAGLVGQRGPEEEMGQDTVDSARAGGAPGQPQPPVTKGIALSSSICLCPAAHRPQPRGGPGCAGSGTQSLELPGKSSCCWCLILLRVLDGMCSVAGTLHLWQ